MIVRMYSKNLINNELEFTPTFGTQLYGAGLDVWVHMIHTEDAGN